MSGDDTLSADNYVRSRRRRLIVIAVILVISMLIALRSVSVSSFRITFEEAMDVIIRNLKGEGLGNIEDTIIFKWALPRAIAGLIIGAILGISGAVMQYCVRNPLADPYTTGISSAALFGVTIHLALGISIIPMLIGQSATIVNAFLFSMIPCIVMVIISVRKKTTLTLLILIGIAVMYMFSALTMIIKYNAEPEILNQILEWSVGSLGRIRWDSIIPLSLALLFLLIFMMYFSRKLDVISSGENMSTFLGVNPTRTRLICMIIISACTSIAVAFSGSIGFVGLIIPHISRLLVGSKSNMLIPCSAVLGALLLVCSDTVSRMFGAELPVGAITALIGSPIFLYFLFKIRTNGWGR